MTDVERAEALNEQLAAAAKLIVRLTRERDEARADLRRLANAAAGVHNEVGAMIDRDGMYEPSVPTFVAEELAELDAALREIMPRLRGKRELKE